MSTTQGRKIAIVGAAGNLGREILAGLLGKGIHTITAISRNDSNATFPDGVRVLKGDYADEGFLSSALEGQEVLVLALAYFASKQQIPLIRAAAKAGIRYVLPVEFGSDPNATELLKALQMTAEKKVYRDLSESVGVSWIAVVSNPWFDWSLAGGHWGFDIKSRTVDLYDGGAAKFVTTTIRTTGQATAGLLSLPENELAEFKNAPLYLMSFRISQQDILQSLLRVTNTQDKDWNVQLQDGEKSAAKAREEAAKGSFEASIKAHYVPHMIDGLGGDYSAKVLDMRRLGVEPEDLDTVVKTVVQGLE